MWGRSHLGDRTASSRARWVYRGGDVESLRKAVHYGPWRFVRESDGDLYVYHAGAKDYAGPNERLWRERQRKDRAKQQAKPEPEPAEPEPPPKMPPKVAGIYQHGPLCDCWLCEEDEDTVRKRSYVRFSEARSGA